MVKSVLSGSALAESPSVGRVDGMVNDCVTREC